MFVAGLSSGNSEVPGGLGVLTTNGCNGQRHLRAAAPVLVPLKERLAMSPEARPELLTVRPRDFSPEVRGIVSAPPHGLTA